MRKCGSCGYLLLGDGDSCGRCGALLPAAAAGPAAAPGPAVAQDPAAPLRSPFGRLSIPAPVPVAATTPAAASGAGSPPPPAPDTRSQWSPAVPPEMVTVASGAPRATRLGVIALVMALAFAAGFGVMHLRSDPLPAGTSAFVDGKGVTYTSTDQSFQVRLPQAPTLDTSTMTLNSMTATIFTATTEGNGYQIAVASIEFPDRLTSAQVKAALDAAFKERISIEGGKVEQKDLTMRGTLPAVEGRVDAGGGRHAHMLIVASDTALVLIAVAAKSGTDRLYKALEASLVVR